MKVAYIVDTFPSVSETFILREITALRDLGVSEPQLKRLHGPVGLAIGSRTPAEIAVAIMAEVTAARNGVDTRRTPAADAA